MLRIIRNLLQQIIDDIDSGNSYMSEKEQLETIDFINKINSKELSKLESADYIGVSRATFDNYVRDGFIPKGRKRMGFKELSWSKYDLDNFFIHKKDINK